MKEHQSRLQHPQRLHLPKLIWIAFILISLTYVNWNVRIMKETVTEVMRAQQAAIDQPRQLTIQTIHISPALRRDEMNLIETSSDHLSQGRYAAKKTIDPIPNIEMLFRQQLLEQNRVDGDQKEAFRYKLGLVRLIGDPIQSNQSEEHTLQNLEFLLQHEPHFKTTVHKHWILNRISNENFLEQAKQILNLNNQTFSVLDSKNPNSARNFALNLYNQKWNGNSRPAIDYILPWDGDCFLSQSAHDSLQRDLERHNDEQQKRIAKARSMLRKEVRADDDIDTDEGADDDFLDNELSNLIKSRSVKTLINAPIKYFYTPVEKFEQSPSEFKPMQVENDLQLVFHRTAKARFDPSSPSTTGMLKKLKIRGPWDIGNPLRPVQKDFNYHQFSIRSSSSSEESSDKEKLSLLRNDDVGSPAVGWVTRLFSSQSTLQPDETATKQDQSQQY